ncbi:hypothetical protein GCM10010381_11750 [Streptomyces xantholiticus]|nr:hypothetical protein GCM10010381_11750 [Streptomyces xantholiticus]
MSPHPDPRPFGLVLALLDRSLPRAGAWLLIRPNRRVPPRRSQSAGCRPTGTPAVWRPVAEPGRGRRRPACASTQVPPHDDAAMPLIRYRRARGGRRPES